MGGLSRRRFLELSLGCGAGILAGAEAGEAHPARPHPHPRLKLLGLAPFVDEGGVPMGRKTGAGLDGRLFTDLTHLDGRRLITSTDQFYIRTARSDLLDYSAPWFIDVNGEVEKGATLTVAELYAAAAPQGAHLMECAGNAGVAHFGMMSTAEWAGVPLLPLLRERVAFRTGATRVRVKGFDKYDTPATGSVPGASWVFTFADLERAGAFLATHMNGAPLEPDHGYPVRLLVPNWYGCTDIKWVNEIRLVDDNEPATSQMIEYARRTHQKGVPKLARDYIAAVMDLAAMPIRVEMWKVGAHVVYNVVGIMWGGDGPTRNLAVRFNPIKVHAPRARVLHMIAEPYAPVVRYAPQSREQRWFLWAFTWRPRFPGQYAVQLRVNDPRVRTRRLDSGFYTRIVQIDRV